jgi:3-oxoacyl-[acyl-carrier-protein] synthase II
MMESLEHALKRGAPIFGEMIGYDTKSDAYHANASHPEGAGGALTMKSALANAGISTDEVDIISAHATSTKVGDISEANAIEQVFKERAETIPVIANKSALGHSQGAAGAMEAIALLKALEEGVIPPTINIDELDPQIKLNVVTQKAINKNLNIGISNSFGFGGHCSTIVLKKYS